MSAVGEGIEFKRDESLLLSDFYELLEQKNLVMSGADQARKDGLVIQLLAISACLQKELGNEVTFEDLADCQMAIADIRFSMRQFDIACDHYFLAVNAYTAYIERNSDSGGWAKRPSSPLSSASEVGDLLTEAKQYLLMSIISQQLECLTSLTPEDPAYLKIGISVFNLTSARPSDCSVQYFPEGVLPALDREHDELYSGQAQYALSLSFASRGKFAEAVKALEKAQFHFEVNDSLPLQLKHAQYGLARLHGHLGELRKAADMMSKVNEGLTPEHMTSEAYKSVCENWDKAIGLGVASLSVPSPAAARPPESPHAFRAIASRAEHVRLCSPRTPKTPENFRPKTPSPAHGS